MTTDIDGLKRKFRDGRRDEAIAECEAHCLAEPSRVDVKKLCAMMHAVAQNYSGSLVMLQQVLVRTPHDTEVLFNIGMCHRALNDYARAAEAFGAYAKKLPNQPDGWASAAESRFKLGDHEGAVSLADRAIQRDRRSATAWTVRGGCLHALGRFREAVTSFDEAIGLDPEAASLRVQRGDAYDSLGDSERAAADYSAALKLAPNDGLTLKKATVCLLQSGRGDEGILLCRETLERDPDNITAKLGAEWLLTQLVPLWHVPMMNEDERNLAYFEGLKPLVAPDKVVFEIGTGSGLLAMMAARLGAEKVYTCEAVRLVADTATKIVARNGYQDRVTVLSKPSYAVQVGKDMPERADILVHEIFSSELLGESVLPALEDAKARLLKPGGRILPAAASIMIALIGGTELGSELHVGNVLGFDLSPFNAINPRKRPIHREDLPRVLLSEGVEAFRFDFANDSSFPADKKRLRLGAVKSGLCYGVIQWIRFELGEGVEFENHPNRRRPVASWQQTIYRFDEPLQVAEGSVVSIDASHDRTRPWFDLSPEAVTTLT